MPFRPQYLIFAIYFCITLTGCSKGASSLSTPPDLDEMVLVPAGEFIMGSDINWKEAPPHTEYVGSFWIAKYEVTVGQYKKFVDATGHRAPKYWFRNEDAPREGTDLLPVVYVDYFDASAYCEWAGKRLPTEAEWEKAARGKDGNIYPWGDTWDPGYANTWEKGGHRRVPVNSFPQGASPYGALNMGGNVWEWTSSWLVNYPGSKDVFDFTGTDIVLKGGSWLDFADSTRPAQRHEFTPYVRYNTVGFRCAKDEGKAN